MRTILSFIACLLYYCSYAQLPDNISSFTTRNGLSNNTITSLQKDADGFLWIGTHEGLNRYDGTAFINVLSNAKNNFPSNNITKITVISPVLLAVGTDAGLCLLNTATLTGKKIALPFLPQFSNTGTFISDILYKQETKELWVCTWHGIFVLNTEGVLQKKMMARVQDMGKGFFSRYLLKDPKGDVCFYSQQQNAFYYPDFLTQQLDPVEKRMNSFVLNDFLRNKFSMMSVQSFGAETIAVLSKTISGENNEYLYYYNAATGRNFMEKIMINFPSEKRLFNAFPLNDSIFIVNSYFGTPLLYNTNRHEIKPAAERPLWFTSWPDGLGAFFYKDENNVWIGTSKSLLQFSSRANFFSSNTALTDKLKNNTSLVSYNYGIYKDNKFWLACMGAGLFSLDTTTNKIEAVFNNNTPAAYSKKIVSTAVVDAGKALWLFSVYGPVQVDPLSKKMGDADATGKDPFFDYAASFPLRDSKGNIWISLPEGVSKYNIADNHFTNFKTVYAGGSFPVYKAGPKTEDGHGNIWMARQDTLVKYDVAKNIFSTFLLRKNGNMVTPVTSIASDGDDVLYIAAAGSFGIYHISSGDIDLFTKQTGIVSTAINGIVSDYQGNAWIATEGGLVFYNRQKKKCSSFTKADGLPDDEVVSLNFTDKQKKTLFLGFSKTYALFQPQHFLLEKTVPINMITSAEEDGEIIALGASKTFNYKQNSISFTYTGINYNEGQQNNYACMLEGLDQDWKYTGTERKINYINLPPGKYTFKVKSANHQGEWNETPATFSFEITPPFWQRWWFRILAFCLIISGIYYFIKKREAALQKENKLKLQMSELRMQALRAQMNPHFIFNSLNSIQNYILSNNTIDAAGYLSKFAKLMRRILDQSKHNFLPLGEVMDTLKLYVEMEAFRFSNEFSYVFDIPEYDDLLDAPVPPMLLQPFVENAILHGLMPKKGDKRLLISCVRDDDKIIILIDDNGTGRTLLNAKAGHESQGEKLTAGMLESLQQMQHTKASIETIDKTENGIASGTTIKLILPLN